MNNYFLLSTVLSFLGLGAAALVAVLNLFRLRRQGFRWDSSLYLVISLVYAGRLALNLRQQFTGIACALPPQRILLVYGGLLLFHLGFAWDSWRAFAGRSQREKGGEGHDQ